MLHSMLSCCIQCWHVAFNVVMLHVVMLQLMLSCCIQCCHVAFNVFMLHVVMLHSMLSCCIQCCHVAFNVAILHSILHFGAALGDLYVALSDSPRGASARGRPAAVSALLLVAAQLRPGECSAACDARGGVALRAGAAVQRRGMARQQPPSARGRSRRRRGGYAAGRPGPRVWRMES